MTAPLRIAVIIIIGFIASLWAAPAAAAQPSEFVDVALGDVHDGSVWNILWRPGTVDPTELRWTRVMFGVDLVFTDQAGRIRNQEAASVTSYMTEFRCSNGQTFYLWKLGPPASATVSRDFRGSLLTTLSRGILADLRPGERYTYEITIWTENGMRFSKNGAFTVAANAHDALEQGRERNLQRVSEAHEKMRQFPADSWSHCRPYISWIRETANRITADIRSGYLTTDQALAEVSQLRATIEAERGRAKPSDWPPSTLEFMSSAGESSWEAWWEAELNKGMMSIERIYHEILDPRAVDALKRFDRSHVIIGSHIFQLTADAAETRRYVAMAHDVLDDPEGLSLLPRDLRGAPAVDRRELRSRLSDARMRLGQLRAAIDQPGPSALRARQRDAQREMLEEIANLERRLEGLGGPGFDPDNNEAWRRYLTTRQRILGSFDVTDPQARIERAEALATLHDWVFVEDDGTVRGALADDGGGLSVALRQTLTPEARPVQESFGTLVLETASTLSGIAAGIDGLRPTDQSKPILTALREMVAAGDELREINAALDTLGGADAAARLTAAGRAADIRDHLVRTASIVRQGDLSPQKLAEAIALIEALPPAQARPFEPVLSELRRLERLHSAGGLSRIAARLHEWVTRQGDLGLGDLFSTYERMTEVTAFRDLSALDRVALGIAVVGAVEEWSRSPEGFGVESALRQSAKLAVDVAFTVFPVAGTADLISFFVLSAAVSYDAGEFQALSISELSKMCVDAAFDAVGAAVAAGTEAVHGTNPRHVISAEGLARTALSIARVESHLMALPPGHEDQAGLLRQRRILRQALRARDNVHLDPDHHFILIKPFQFNDASSPAEPARYESVLGSIRVVTRPMNGRTLEDAVHEYLTSISFPLRGLPITLEPSSVSGRPALRFEWQIEHADAVEFYMARFIDDHGTLYIVEARRPRDIDRLGRAPDRVRLAHEELSTALTVFCFDRPNVPPTAAPPWP